MATKIVELEQQVTTLSSTVDRLADSLATFLESQKAPAPPAAPVQTPPSAPQIPSSINYRKEAARLGIAVKGRAGAVSQEVKDKVHAAIYGKADANRAARAVQAPTVTSFGTFKVSSGNGRMSNREAGELLVHDPDLANMRTLSGRAWRLVSLFGKGDNPNPANISPADRATAYRMTKLPEYVAKGAGQSLQLAACGLYRVLVAAGLTPSILDAEAAKLGL